MVQMVLCIVFFFKQKTAYEMRISDWSSECALPISRGPHRRPARGDPDRGQGPMAGLRGETRQGKRQGLGGVRLRGRGQLAGHPADCGRRCPTGASLKTPPVGATPPTALLVYEASVASPRPAAILQLRSEKSRVGKECVRTCISRWM